MTILLDRPVTRSDTDTVPEMLIDFATGTWTCAEHGAVMNLDSGLDCPQCAAHAPPDLDSR